MRRSAVPYGLLVLLVTDGLTIGWTSAQVEEVATEVLVVPVSHVGELPASAQGVLRAMGVQSVKELLLGGTLPAGPAWQRTIPALGRLGAVQLMLIAIDGRDDPAEMALLEAAMVAGAATRSVRMVAFVLPASARDGRAIQLVAEGFALGRYSFDRYRGSSEPAAASTLQLFSSPTDAARVESMGRRGLLVARAANWVRELVDAPPCDLTPSAFVDAVEAAAGEHGLMHQALAGDDLMRERLAGLVAVGAGAADSAQMVELAYNGDPSSDQHFALVGKGITFDTGGLDLKPLGWMFQMKNDMAGAAVVVAATVAAAQLGLPVNIRTYIAVAENTPGPGALRPGDVISHRNGVTTEVFSPDGEGRLVLADVLSLAAEREPMSIIEVSTLTGGTGLGDDVWGVVSSPSSLGEALVAAGAVARDPGWRLPMWPSYRRYLESPIADQRNMQIHAGFPMSAVLGAVFLDRFVPKDVKWAHVDIGATAMRTSTSATAAWGPGATGSFTRALVEWLDTSPADAR